MATYTTVVLRLGKRSIENMAIHATRPPWYPGHHGHPCYPGHLDDSDGNEWSEMTHALRDLLQGYPCGVQVKVTK